MTISGQSGALRVSNTEREPVVERLRHAYVEGRLDELELDRRLHLALTAKTRADLDAVLVDLAPAATPLPPTPMGPPPGPVDPSAGERLLAALGHALGICTLFVGPLIMFCVSARRSPYVRSHLVAALNFQLTLLLVTIVTFGVGAIAYSVAWVVVAVAAVLGLAGTPFRYPCTLNLIR